MGLFGPSKREREEAAKRQAETAELRGELRTYFEGAVKETRAELARQRAYSARTDEHVDRAAAQYLLRQAESQHSIMTGNLAEFRKPAKEPKPWWRS